MRAMLSLLGLFCLTACASAPPPPPDNTPARSAAAHEEGGIGGTGIFGTITAMGSIEVNGLRIALADEALAPPLGDDTPLRLAAGQTVLIDAEDTERAGILRAARVRPFLALRGPITALDANARTLAVMGTPVALQDDTRLVDAEGAPVRLADLRLGDALAVSGLWRGATVVASWLSPVQDGAPALLNGLAQSAGPQMRIGATPLDAACCPPFAQERFVATRGAFDGTALVAERVAVGSDLLFDDGIGRVVVEAYLSADADGAGLHLSGFGIPMAPGSIALPAPGARAIFTGRLNGGLRVERHTPPA